MPAIRKVLAGKAQTRTCQSPKKIRNLMKVIYAIQYGYMTILVGKSVSDTSIWFDNDALHSLLGRTTNPQCLFTEIEKLQTTDAETFYSSLLSRSIIRIIFLVTNNYSYHLLHPQFSHKSELSSRPITKWFTLLISWLRNHKFGSQH